MDFLPQIEAPAHPRFEVPWFGSRDKVYIPRGLSSWMNYPHEEGYNLQHLIEGDFHGKTWAEAAGFVQRWAYWGMISEFFNISDERGLETWPLQQPQKPDDGTAQLRAFSASLPDILLAWQRIPTDSQSPNADAINRIRFVKIALILKRVHQFYTALYARESAWIERDERDKGDDKPRRARSIYCRHKHTEEQPRSWDDDLQNRPRMRSFYTDEPHSGNSPLDSPGHALILSIAVVGELLFWATEGKYKWKMKEINWAVPLAIRQRMSFAGWCPMWLRRLKDEGSIIRACYLSSIPRMPSNRHTKCCYFACVASQVNIVTYQTKHLNEGCGCQNVSFDLGEQSEYASWIKTGQYPLIVWNSGEWKLVRSHDVENGTKKNYVAISHVWVDGTGNANGNALPSCQLRKFQTASNQLYDENYTSMDTQIPFWVDTICVPFKIGQTKALAIKKMEQIFRDADNVLVFDSGLQQISVDAPASECLTQIEISSWNERLWTIQEAAFAKALFFHFKDGTKSLQELLLRYRLERFGRLALFRYGAGSELIIKRFPLIGRILDELLQPVLEEKSLSIEKGRLKRVGIGGLWAAFKSDALFKLPSGVELDGLQLDAVFMGTFQSVPTFFMTLGQLSAKPTAAQRKWSFLEKVLPYRQTSIASDEGLCIATLLNMDQSSLHDLPDEERVRRMFLHVGTISCGILFGDRPRLTQAGYRWMASTFVNQPIEMSDRTAQVTELGVKAQLPGLLVKFPAGKLFLRIPADLGGGIFGFGELDQDHEYAPGHVMGDVFPLRLEGTNQMYLVRLLLPDRLVGVVTGSQIFIILEQPLTQDAELDPESIKHPYRHIIEEWKQLGIKKVKQAFLVHPARETEQAMEYRAAATVTRIDHPLAEQLAAAAVAQDLGDVEWLIS